MTGRIGTTEVREEGFYWVILGRNPAGNRLLGARRMVAGRRPKPWQLEAVTVASERLVFTPRLVPVP